MLATNDTPILRGRNRRRAIQILQNGGVVAIPTETVYGLAADATSDAACQAIYHAKGRANDNPLIAHACNRRMLMQCVSGYPSYLPALLRAFTPGPLTIILPKSASICDTATCSLPTVAIRIPRHRATRRLIAAVGRPLAAPSANLSGQLSATTAEMAQDALAGRIDAIVDGGKSRIGVESTIIHAEEERITIVRLGLITATMFRRVLGKRIAVNEGKDANRAIGVTPGSKYHHYRPRIPLRITENPARSITAQKQRHNGVAIIITSRMEYRELRAIMGAHNRRLILVKPRAAHSSDRAPYVLRLRPLRARDIAQHSPDHATPYYCCRIYNAKKYARLFYSLCHFFDQLQLTEIIAPYPRGHSGYARSLGDRVSRASETPLDTPR